MSKKIVFIAGPITGVERYWEAFERAEDELVSMGYIPLSPAHLPAGMSNDKYARINFAMIDSADAVLFLKGWDQSEGARLEHQYCVYRKKPRVRLVFDLQESHLPALYRALVKKTLEEAIKK